MGAGAQLQGADDLVRTLQSAARDLEDLTDVERQAGELLAEQGSKNAPRYTGYLAERHGYTLVRAGVEVVAATAYAAIVHAHNPWLARTVLAAEDQVADLYLAGVDQRLAHVKGI